MNKLYSVLVVMVMAVSFAACTNNGEPHRNPGRIYAPDMTYSRAYDYYNANPNFSDRLTARIPVQGTIARGDELPDHMMEGDTNGYKGYRIPARFDEAGVNEGRRLFNIYCAICHGPNMDGNGPIYANGKFAAMPANLIQGKYLTMDEGTIYAAIKYGKNAMGSYASQLDVYQRWQVIAYIKKFQSEKGGAPFALGTKGPTGGASPDSSAVAPVPGVDLNQTDGEASGGQATQQGATQRTRH
jgi:mono/diheme cytochrome c family protein